MDRQDVAEVLAKLTPRHVCTLTGRLSLAGEQDREQVQHR
jgi:hypothetical protein